MYLAEAEGLVCANIWCRFHDGSDGRPAGGRANIYEFDANGLFVWKGEHGRRIHSKDSYGYKSCVGCANDLGFFCQNGCAKVYN